MYQLNPQGTGHAVLMSLPFLKNYKTLIVNSDTPLIDSCLHEIILKEPPCIMVTQLDNPSGQGRIIMKMNEDGNFIFSKIVEEKDATKEEKKIKFVNCGIYFLESKHLKETIPFLTNNNAQKEYYLTDIFEKLNEKFHLYFLPREKQYQILNVNTPEDLEKAIEYSICYDI
jgi:bifunctional UDP-N-acetylglucosamine pyrophosphorylase/glucosamine-1-phosphate N-acetyltransferase